MIYKTVILKLLYSSCYTQVVILKLLYSSCYTPVVILQLLYSSCYTICRSYQCPPVLPVCETTCDIKCQNENVFVAGENHVKL